MSVRLLAPGNATVVNATLVTTAETVALTSAPLILAVDNAQILIFWYVVATMGTGTTALVIRLRRGTTTAGALVNTAPGPTVTAGSGVSFSGCYVDSPGVVAGQQYAITLAQTAATANGTVVEGSIIAMVL